MAQKDESQANILSLPAEIISLILQFFSPDETRIFIRSINILRKELSPILRTSLNLGCLLELALLRLYGGRIRLTSQVKKDEDDYNSTQITVQEFIDKFKKGDSDAQEYEYFARFSPHTISIEFVREVRDYKQFLDDIGLLNQVFESLRRSDVVSNCFESAGEVELYINGNAVSIESPSAIWIAIMRTLINLTTSKFISGNFFSGKFTKVSIVSTDLGNYYVSRWSKLLSFFSNLTYLNLSDNMLKLDIDGENFGDSFMKVDIFADDFIWPSKLKTLILDHNLISYISKNFVEKLPSNSLEELLIGSNRLITVGVSTFEEFSLAENLPKLKKLNLRGNNGLISIGTKLFEKDTHIFEYLDVSKCNLDRFTLSFLKMTSSSQDFKLLY